MGINIGNHPLDNCKLGSQQVEVIYLGENEVWSFIQSDRLFVYFSNQNEIREINKTNAAVINTSQDLSDINVTLKDMGGTGRRLFVLGGNGNQYYEFNVNTLTIINSLTGSYTFQSVGGTGKTLLFSGTNPAYTMQVNPDNFSFTQVARTSFYPFIDGINNGAMYYWTLEDDQRSSELYTITGVDSGSPILGSLLQRGTTSRDIGGTKTQLFTLNSYSIDERNTTTGAVINNFGNTNYTRMGGTK